MSRNKITRQRFPGEKHIPLRTGTFKVEIANFAGPGTNLKERLERGFKPLTQGDKGALAHDIRYELAKTNKDIRKADNKLIDATEKIDRGEITDPETPYHSRFNTTAIRKAMQIKKLGENTGLFSSETFTETGKNKELDEDYKKILIEKLNELEKLGYGYIPVNKVPLLLNKFNGNILENKISPDDIMAEQKVEMLNKTAREFKYFLNRLADEGMEIPRFGGECCMDENLTKDELIEYRAGDLIGGMVELLNLIIQKGDLKPIDPSKTGTPMPFEVDFVKPKKKPKTKKYSTTVKILQEKDDMTSETKNPVVKSEKNEDEIFKTKKGGKLTPSRYTRLVREIRKSDPSLSYNQARKMASQTLKTKSF